MRSGGQLVSVAHSKWTNANLTTISVNTTSGTMAVLEMNREIVSLKSNVSDTLLKLDAAHRKQEGRGPSDHTAIQRTATSVMSVMGRKSTKLSRSISTACEFKADD